MRRLILVALIWGWSFLFIKIAVAGAPPLFVSWSRVTLGALTLLWLLRSARERLPDRRHWAHAAVLGLLMAVIPFTAIAWGEERIASALASVLLAAMPLLTSAVLLTPGC